MKKTVSKLILGLAIFVILIMAAVALFVDVLAEKGMERAATYALGVESDIADVDLSLLRGSLSVTEFRLSNPQGFTTDHLMNLGRMDVQLRTSSLFSDTVELDKFEIDGLDVIIEQKGAKSNVLVVMDHAKSRGGTSKDEQPDGQGKKIKVDRIVIKNVVAHFYLLPDIAPGGPITVRVPQIVLTDVTSDNASGVVAGELVRRIVPAILEVILKNAQGAVPSDYLAGLSSGVGEAAAAIGSGAQVLTEGAKAKLDAILDGDQSESGGEKSDQQGQAEPDKGLGGLLRRLGGDKKDQSDR